MYNLRQRNNVENSVFAYRIPATTVKRISKNDEVKLFRSFQVGVTYRAVYGRGTCVWDTNALDERDGSC